MRGWRIGEAAIPGPPRRITGTLRLPSGEDIASTSVSQPSTEVLRTVSTQYDATTGSSSNGAVVEDEMGSGHIIPPNDDHAARAGQDEVETARGMLTPPRRPAAVDGSPNEPPTPGHAEQDQAPPIMVKLVSGYSITLACRWIKGTRSWRWQAGARSRKLTRDSRQGPRHALEQWIVQHGAQLHEEGLTEVRQALALMPSDVEATPPPASTPRRRRQSAPMECDTETPPTQRTSNNIIIPSAQECREIAEMSPQEFLGCQVISQRTLPASVKAQVTNVLTELWKIGEDLTNHSDIRRASRVMWITAPRWAWPETTRPPGGRLTPHARPNLVKAQLTSFLQGHWRQCLTGGRERRDDEDLAGNLESGLDRPGLLTEAKLERLSSFARQQRLGKGWKHLWSWGVPMASTDLNYTLRQMLSPPDRVPEDLREFPQVSEGDALQMFGDASWQRATKTLHAGRAPDACGWTQDILRSFLQHAQLSKIIKQLAQGLITMRWDGTFLDLLCMGRVAAIFKNSQASLRPITIPSIWRKLIGAWTAHSWSGLLKPHVADRQYGVGCSNGSIVMAHDVNHTLECHEGWAAAHLDIFSAFTTVQRSKVIEALNNVDDRLLASQTHCQSPQCGGRHAARRSLL